MTAPNQQSLFPSDAMTEKQASNALEQCPYCRANRAYVSEHGDAVYGCFVVERKDETVEQTKECLIRQLTSQLSAAEAALAEAKEAAKEKAHWKMAYMDCSRDYQGLYDEYRRMEAALHRAELKLAAQTTGGGG